MVPKEILNMRPLKGNEKFERDSEFLGADDISQDTEPVLTIKNLYRGKVTLSRGKEVKNVMTFVEETVPGITEVRPMIVNSTNRQTLKKLYGQVTASALEGKKIQLYIEHNVRNPSNGEMTDGIRIRDRKPSAGGAAKAAPKCSSCGKEITGMSGFTAEQIASGSKLKYGKCLCMECGQKMKAQMEEAARVAAEAAGAVENVAEEKAEAADKVTATSNLAAQLMEDE